MPGSRKCPPSCRCGKHQGGAGWNPFKHAKRDFGNVGKAFKKAGKAVHNNAAARKILGTIARTGAARFGFGGLADAGLKQVGYGRKSLKAGGGGRGSIKAGGGRRRRK